MAQDNGDLARTPAEGARITRILHTIHATRAVDPLRRTYLHVFGGLAFSQEYHAGEDRDMALIYVADHMIEPMAPRRPDEPDTTMSRYLVKYGPGWHSLAFATDDAAETSRRVRAAGARLTTDYPGPPGFFFVHPEATGGVVVEVTDYRMTNDPFDEPSWSPDWAAARTRQPARLRCPVLVVRDLAPALAFFAGALDGRVVDQSRREWPEPAACARVAIGDGEILLLAPLGSEGRLTDVLARPFSGVYALAWEVRDLAATCAWLAENGLAPERTPDGAEVIVEGARHWLLPVGG